MEHECREVYGNDQEIVMHALVHCMHASQIAKSMLHATVLPNNYRPSISIAITTYDLLRSNRINNFIYFEK